MAQQLFQFQYAVDQIFSSARTTLIHYSTNPNVLKLINYTNLSEVTLYETMQKISQTEVPADSYVCFYNGASNRIFYDGRNYAAENFPDQDLVSYLQNPDYQINGEQLISRKTSNYEMYSESLYDYTRLAMDTPMYTLIYMNTKPDISAVILNIPVSHLYEALENLPDIQNEILVIDGEGNVQFSGSHHYEFLSNVIGDPVFDRILSNSDDDYFLGTVGQESSLISHISSKTGLDWHYIRITPYGLISAQLNEALMKSIFIIFCVMLPLLLIGFLLSKRIYKIHQMQILRIEQHYQEKNQSGFLAQQQFLRYFIQNNIDESEKIWKQIQLHHLNFDKRKPFRVLLFAIDDYKKYSEEVVASDRDLFSYGIINILNEIFSQVGTVHTLSHQERNYVVICNGFTSDLPPQKWVELSMQAQQSIQNYFQISLSAIIGTPDISLSALHNEVRQCIEAAKYRTFRGYNMVAFLSEIQEIQNNAYFPSDSELHHIIDNLFLGRKEEVYRLCNELLSHEYSWDTLKIVLLKLLFYIQEGVESKGGEIQFSHINEWLKFVSNISGDISMMDIQNWLSTFIEEAFEELHHVQIEQIKTQKNGIKMEDVKEKISHAFGDPNLTPESLALQFGISSNYFKRLFKADVGISLNEYINQVRLKHAGEFLICSQSSAVEIAQNCGFANINYFYTLFKKRYHMTPTEYRKLHQKETS